MATKNAEPSKNLLFVDTPVATATADKFHHSVYVSTLKKIIADCKTPINVGIFAKWGTGKSSIVNLLAQSLEADSELSKKLKFLEPFDVWKYSGDSLRRQFLIHLNSQLPRSHQISAIDERLYATTEEETEHQAPALPTLPLILGGFVVILLVFILSMLQQRGLVDALVVGVAVTFLTILLKRHESLIQSIKRKKVFPRVESPEQFERIFEEILARFEHPKLVLVIDNLDRCHENTVVDTLAMVKTFLEKPKCVFLIPCDDEAIREYLNRTPASSLVSKSRDGEEFLRKFFQASVVISPYIEEALETYAYNLLEEVQLSSQVTEPQRKALVQVVVSGYARNPRRIKQSFNTLITALILAREKEAQSLLVKGTVTQDPAFLLKLLVIREEWSPFFRVLTDDYKLLKYIEQFFQGASFDDVPPGKLERIGQFFQNFDGLERFLRSTRLIGADISDIRPFLTLQQESFEAAIPDIRAFRENLRQGDFAYFQTIMAGADESQVASYLKEIVGFVKIEFSQGYFQFAFNGLDVALKIFPELPQKHKLLVANDLAGKLASAEFSSFLERLAPKAVFSVIQTTTAFRDRLIARYVEIFIAKMAHEHLRKSIAAAFAEHASIIPFTMKSQLVQHLENSYASKEKEPQILDTLEILSSNPSEKGSFVSDQLLQLVIRAIDPAEADKPANHTKRLEVFLSFKADAGEGPRALFVEQMVKFLTHAATGTIDPPKAFALDALGRLDADEIPESASTVLFDSLTALMAKVASPTDKLRFIRSLLSFVRRFSESQKGDLVKKHFTPFINGFDQATCQSFLSLLGDFTENLPSPEDLLQAIASRLVVAFPTASTSVDSFLDLCWKAGRPSEIVGLVEKLLGTPHYKIALDTARKHFEKLAPSDLERIGRVALTRYKGLPATEWPGFWDLIVVLKERFSQDFIDDFAEDLEKHVEAGNPQVSPLALHTYEKLAGGVSSTKAMYLCNQVIERLNSVIDTFTPAHAALVQFILSEQKRCPTQTLERLIDLLLRLAHESKPPETKSFAYQFLQQLDSLHQKSGYALDQLLDIARRESDAFREQPIRTVVRFKSEKAPKDFWRRFREFLEEQQSSSEEALASAAREALDSIPAVGRVRKQ